jgi:4-amino-4-deoxy-L-arabinose transferase-like glycosyltransferase
MSEFVSPALGGSAVISRIQLYRAALCCIALLAALLRLWNLGDAGFGTDYYAASVRSMLTNPNNAFFAAFDPAGILAIDKPPLALWVQAISAGLFGFSPFTLMLPQAIEGCASVVLVWHLTRRDMGEAAGLLAALFLALTPISIAVDRSNNTDSLLVLTLLLAAWALPRGGDQAAPWRFALAMALVGVAFNVKMVAAFGVLPSFVAAYLFTAKASWPRRIAHLAASGVVLLAVSGSWIGSVALTAPAFRPYIDSTGNNSIFDLVINHNAAQRFIPRAPAARQPTTSQTAIATTTDVADTNADMRAVSATMTRFAARNVPAGASRLLDPRLARQALWLLPLALAGAIGMILARHVEAACVWIGWAAAYWGVFSAAGGLFAPYYMVMLAPPMAVLAATGVPTIAAAWREGGRWRWLLPAVLALGVVWQADILRPPNLDNEPGVLLLTALVALAAAILALRPWLKVGSASIGLAIGVIGLMIAPAAWSVGTVAYEYGRPLARLQPTGTRAGRAFGQEREEVLALLPFLRENRRDTAFLAATSSARLAAPLIIETGESVMAFGGFLGSIPVRDGEAIGQLVENGDLRFAIIDRRDVLPAGRRRNQASSDAAAWIHAHGSRIDLTTLSPRLRDARFDLFDLRPDQ